MELLPVTDLAALSHYASVEGAAMAQDHVALPADSLEELAPLLSGVPRLDKLVLLYVAREAGRPVATLSVNLPLLDNLEVASVAGHVHPDVRRQGRGSRLLGAALEVVRSHGRTRVLVESHAPLAGGEGMAGPLMRSAGARPVMDDVRRLLDLTAAPPGPTAPPAEGYRVVQWRDRCPDEYVEGATYLAGRMTVDPPTGERDYAPERWDVTRFRDKEREILARHRTRIVTAVVHEPTGTLAGITDIGAYLGAPEVAFQWDTIVDPDHRGHGLGLSLKQWNHAALVREVPGVRWVNTWNAAANGHMIAINDALGFQPVERWLEWQLDL